MERTPLARIKLWLKGQMLSKVYGMLTCREFEEFVQAYHDGELTQKELRLFNFHMKVCEECRDYVVSYKQSTEISTAVLSKPHDTEPNEVSAELIRTIVDSK